jgi:hypothetical protein
MFAKTASRRLAGKQGAAGGEAGFRKPGRHAACTQRNVYVAFCKKSVVKNLCKK